MTITAPFTTEDLEYVVNDITDLLGGCLTIALVRESDKLRVDYRSFSTLGFKEYLKTYFPNAKSIIWDDTEGVITIDDYHIGADGLAYGNKDNIVDIHK
jgi:hypothetical protein